MNEMFTCSVLDSVLAAAPLSVVVFEVVLGTAMTMSLSS